MKIPVLNFHSLDITNDFSSLEELLDCFAKGCRNLEPRAREAVLVSVIVAELEYSDYPFSEYFKKFHGDFPACSRLMFTLLHAKELAKDHDNEKRIELLIQQISPFLSEPCDLFTDMPVFPQFGVDLAKKAHVKNGFAWDEIHKRIP